MKQLYNILDLLYEDLDYFYCDFNVEEAARVQREIDLLNKRIENYENIKHT